MDVIRRVHNLAKRDHIEHTVQRGHHVLDMGCGAGGDLLKWKQVGAKVDLYDPSSTAVQKARERVEGLGMSDRIQVMVGDIRTVRKKYDVICYNFALQYIFESKKLFFESIKSISQCLKVGGILTGCIPDSDWIIMRTPFRDELGNFLVRKDDTGYGLFGERVHVHLTDTPYYGDDVISEPIAYKDLLVTHLSEYGLRLEMWKPLVKNPQYKLSKLYSKFIFVKEY